MSNNSRGGNSSRGGYRGDSRGSRGGSRGGNDSGGYNNSRGGSTNFRGNSDNYRGGSDNYRGGSDNYRGNSDNYRGNSRGGRGRGGHESNHGQSNFSKNNQYTSFNPNPNYSNNNQGFNNNYQNNNPQFNNAKPNPKLASTCEMVLQKNFPDKKIHDVVEFISEQASVLVLSCERNGEVTVGFNFGNSQPETPQYSLLLLDLTTGEIIREIPQDLEIKTLLGFQKFLFCGCYNGQVYGMDLSSSTMYFAQGAQHSKAVTALSVINNMLFSASSDGHLKIWNFTELGLILTKSLGVDMGINSMVFVQEKSNLILGLQSGQMIAFNENYEKGSINSFQEGVVGLELLEPESVLLCVSAGGAFKAYNVAQNYAEASKNGKEGVKLTRSCVVPAGNTKYLVLAGRNGTIALYDGTMRFLGLLQNVHNAEVRRLRPFQFQGLSFFISVSINGTLAIWKVNGN